MKLSRYELYLAAFNARDYEGVLDHYADSFELHFAGYVLRTKDEVRRFYDFFHSYVREEISLNRYVADDCTAALQAVVQLTAERSLTPEVLASQGLEGLVSLPAGAKVRMEQFIHYHLEGGKIVKAVCAVVGEPEFTPA